MSKHINFLNAIVTDTEGQSYRVESAASWGDPVECEMYLDRPAEYALVGDSFDGILCPFYVSQAYLAAEFSDPNSPDEIVFAD